jgi:hypothetical protein
VQPFWLERQTDLTGPEFVPGAVGRPVENVTHRSWTMVGTLATVDRGIVDPRGLVTPGTGWSLDWWVGADDRWHTPSTEAGIRQHLVDGSPVVETLLRIPGGDAVQRVYAIHAAGDSPFGQAFAVVEVENRSSVPFAIAFAVLPANPVGAAPVTTIALDGTTLLVDGVPGVLLPRTPARAAAVAGDVAAVVVGGGASSGFEPLEAPAGDGQAAVIFPLPHTATIRVVLPLGGRPVPSGRARSRRSAPGGVTYPTAVPTADQVAAGWALQCDREPRLVLPDPSLQALVDAGRRLLVLAHGGEDLATWPPRPLDWVDAASVLGALDRYGFHDEVEQVLATMPERQSLDGSLVGESGRAAANGAALVALGEHWRLCRDGALVEKLVGPVAKAVHWIDKRRTARRGAVRFDADALAWSVRGLRLVADALDAVDQPEVAADARRFADGAADDLAALGGVPVAGETSGAAVVDPVARAGLSPQRTLALASAELIAGDTAALDRLAWVRSIASSTSVWPEVVHPRTGGGSRGDGHHLPSGADLLTFVRDLLVRDTDDGLALCSVLPPAWLGQGFEIHDLPTAWGRLSYAVRWHGERPALLWELDPHPGRPPARLTAPGLDPSWVGLAPRGDALLAAPVVPEARVAVLGAEAEVELDVELAPPPADPGGSFS